MTDRRVIEATNALLHITEPNIFHFIQCGLFNDAVGLLQNNMKILEDEDIEGDTPLFYAVIYNNIELFRYFLENGANVYHFNKNGFHILHYCIKYRLIDFCIMLFMRGFNVNLQSRCGNSALHLACLYGDCRLVHLLLKHENINMYIRNYDGILPIKYAIVNNYTLIIAIFLYSKYDSDFIIDKSNNSLYSYMMNCKSCDN